MLEWDLRSLELEFYTSKHATTIAAICVKLSDYEEEAIRKTKYLGREVTAHQYEESDHPGRTLTCMLHKPWASVYVEELLD
ncbi:hypothetical protein NDU88_003510 [Pleurodeles waltl]|uniref:Uncharacterized protein n=1 Tax=Pleurodeles waltl TaxID=8319 RepID=A0AAV7WTU3_PLEWA|nr:hypothetical protein NDU88_003510 [Pleurodeles waltl]